jgi:hypothetical protein
MKFKVIAPTDLRPEMLVLGTVNNSMTVTPYEMALQIVAIHQVSEPVVGFTLEFAHDKRSDFYASWGAGSVQFAVLDGWAPPADERVVSEADQLIIAEARDLHGIEGEIEIDSNAVVSASADNGSYVAAWVWVPGPDEDEDTNDSNA